MTIYIMIIFPQIKQIVIMRNVADITLRARACAYCK